MIVAFKKVPIVAALPYKCSDLEREFTSIHEMHSANITLFLPRDCFYLDAITHQNMWGFVEKNLKSSQVKNLENYSSFSHVWF